MWGLSRGWNAIFSELSVDDLGKVSESGVSRVTGGLSFRPGRCTGHAEVGDRRRAGAELACGLKLLLGGSEAGLESGDYAEPAFAAGFGDAVVEVVADLDQALCLSRVGSKQRTSDATVLMQARRSEVAGAGAQGDLAQLEVAEELVPFLRREVAVFLCRSPARVGAR